MTDPVVDGVVAKLYDDPETERHANKSFRDTFGIDDLPGLPFHRDSVRTFVPNVERWTVYVILDENGDVIYVGATSQPRVRLLQWIDPAKGMPGHMIRLQFFKNSSQMARREQVLIEEAQILGLKNLRPGQRHKKWNAKRGSLKVERERKTT